MKLRRKVIPSNPSNTIHTTQATGLLMQVPKQPHDTQYLNSDSTAVLQRLIRYLSKAYRLYEVKNRPMIKLYLKTLSGRGSKN